MKVSRKRLFAIDLALSDAVCETLERYIHDFPNRPPEDWSSEEKRVFDVVTEAESALSKKLRELFNA